MYIVCMLRVQQLKFRNDWIYQWISRALSSHMRNTGVSLQWLIRAAHNQCYSPCSLHNKWGDITVLLHKRKDWHFCFHNNTFPQEHKDKHQKGAVHSLENIHTAGCQEVHRTVAMALLCFTASGKGKTCAALRITASPHATNTTTTNKLQTLSRSHCDSI